VLKRPSKKTSFWIISAAIFLSLVTFLNAMDSGSYKLDEKSQRLWSQVNENDKIGVYVQLLEFNSSSQTLKARIWVIPPEKYAYALNSSVQVLYDTAIDISASTINYNSEGNVGYWQANQYLRAIDVELDADNSQVKSLYNDMWFPFDRYSVALTGQIRFLVEGKETESTADDVWESLPIGIQPYTASLSGWSAKYQLDSFAGESVETTFSDGQYFTSDIILERTSLNKVLLILLGLIFLSGGLSMLMLFRSILLAHRPPTLSGLIWAGSTAFTMISTRTIIPGDPRIGVKFDLFIFYPSLVLCFMSAGLMFSHWISKETWTPE
jgi:hypothetical protein